MKKILIVTTVPITLHSILKAQPKFLSTAFDVSLSSSRGEHIKKVEEDEEIKVNIVPMVRGINPFYDLYSLYRMLLLIIKIKPDVVHSYTPKAGLIAMLASFLCKVPVRIHTFTGLIFPTEKGFKKRLLIAMDKLICACTTTVVPEGEGVKQNLSSFDITRKSLNVIGYGNIAGVDTTKFNKNTIVAEGGHLPLIEMLDIEKGSFIFTFVGRFTAEKGVVELLNAFRRLPSSAILLLVGESDSRVPLSQEASTVINEHPRIHNLGWLSDIRPPLAMTNVLVLPSYREGFPNVPLQAGAMKLPCIVSNINGCNEVITNGFNGWVVEPKNEDDLFEAMLASMNSDALELLGKNARSNVIAKFERTEHWHRMLNFYNDELLKHEKSI